MFTNKHVIIALIVAPILSILAWIGVGQFTGETPQAAQSGQSYPLVEKSNCRYVSGACDLENEDFKLLLFYQDGAAGPELVVRSAHPLDGVVLAVTDSEVEAQPSAMRPTDGQGLQWRMALAERPAIEQRIHLVARAGGSSYFADASTSFLQAKEGRLQR